MPPISGFGFCLIWLPAIIGVAKYFDKKRAMANGIASGGAGFGTFILAPVLHFTLEKFGWSWSLILIGAFVLCCLPLGLLFKPIKDSRTSLTTETCEEGDKQEDNGPIDLPLSTETFEKGDKGGCPSGIFARVVKWGKEYLKTWQGES